MTFKVPCYEDSASCVVSFNDWHDEIRISLDFLTANMQNRTKCGGDLNLGPTQNGNDRP
jgi:hypothetical protein